MIKNGWYVCPTCGWDKVQRVERHSTLKDTPIYCRKCKNTSYPNIQDGREPRPVEININYRPPKE